MNEPRYLIVNGDDFGASTGINRGMVEAHRRGILTSTSLMVNMPATEEAVELSAHVPDLSIGLHVNFTNEGDDPVVDVEDLQSCRRELAQQYELFLDLMGRKPTHLDSQHNVHRRPTLWPMFVKLAEETALPLRGHSPAVYFPDFYGQWDGESHFEHISSANLKALISANVGPGITELSCHPGYSDPDFVTTYDLEREAELAALCDPAVADHLAVESIRLIGFKDLAPMA